MNDKPPSAYRWEHSGDFAKFAFLMLFLSAVVVALLTTIADALGADSMAWARRHPVGLLIWATTASILAVVNAHDAISLRWRHMGPEGRDRWIDDA